MNLTEFRKLVGPKVIAANWTESASNRMPYMGEMLFPAQKKAGLDLSWIKGHKGLPVSLMPSAFDAKATFRDRPGVQLLETEMPFFREGFKIKAKDRQDILRIQEKGDPYMVNALNRVFDDAANLIEGALVACERERMQLLFARDGNVGITIVANGVEYVYNYDPAGTWKANNYFALSGQAKWSDAEHSDPFSDIQTAQDAVNANTGSDLRIAVMNKATFKLLRNNAVIKNRFLSKSGLALGYMSDSDIIAVLKDVAELDGVILYDKQFRNENKQARKFVPDGYVALIPTGTLGSTWYGTTPEEADLMNKNTEAQVKLVETGIAITTIPQKHPVNLNIFGSEIVLPSYERMDEVALLKVAEMYETPRPLKPGGRDSPEREETA